MKPISRITLHGLLAIASSLALFSACSDRPRPLSPRESLEIGLAPLRDCHPAPSGVDRYGSGRSAQMAIVSVDRNQDETLVHVVIYAASEPATFTLPLYSPSRGRWLIGESDRTYIADQECREYRLNDVIFTAPRSSPGVLTLRSHEALEGVLKFPPLSAAARLGLLVYGDRTTSLYFPAPGHSN